MTKKKKAPIRKTCADCKKTMTLTNFYATTSSLYPDKRLHICRNCSLRIVETEGFKGFQDLMKLINKPIYDGLYKGEAGDYVRQLNSLPQYRENVYEDSDMFKEIKNTSTKKIELKELTEEELESSENFFGLGYTEEELIWLSSEYADWDSKYNIDSKSLETLIKEACLCQLEIRNKRAQKMDVRHDLKTLQDLLGSSNLKPMQESGNLSAEQTSYGVLIKRFEDEHPIPEPSPEWKDVDNIGKYIRTFFLGHMARMFDKKNEFKEEYDEEMGEHTIKPPRDGES